VQAEASCRGSFSVKWEIAAVEDLVREVVASVEAAASAAEVVLVAAVDSAAAEPREVGDANEHAIDPW